MKILDQVQKPVKDGTALLGGATQGMGVYDSANPFFSEELGTHRADGNTAPDPTKYDRLEFIDLAFNSDVIISGLEFFTVWGHSQNVFAFTIGTGTGAAFTATGSTAQYPSNSTAWFSTVPGYGAKTAIDGTTVNGVLLSAGQTIRLGGGVVGSVASDAPLRTISYAVAPEPSVALLGGIGALALLRRRRA